MVGSGFELQFVMPDGTVCRRRLDWCDDVLFDDVRPVRAFRWSRKLDHFPGWWWTATIGRHVGYESWLERDHVMALDYDRQVTAIASQPFWLCWDDGQRMRRHAPDFFARLADGTGLVVDVRADERIATADAEAFEATQTACAEVGWQFRRVGVIDAVLAANIRWLSRYRHPRCAGQEVITQRLREVFTVGLPLRVGAAETGDPLAVLPVLFHLMWQGILTADLTSAPMCSTTLVRHADGSATGGHQW